MEALPPETLLQIFVNLAPSSSLSVCLTCSRWNELWQDKLLWKEFHSYFGGTPQPPLPPDAWKENYVQTMREMHAIKRQEEAKEDGNTKVAIFFHAISRGHTVLVHHLDLRDPDLKYHPKKHNERSPMEHALFLDQRRMFTTLRYLYKKDTRSDKVWKDGMPRYRIEECWRKAVKQNDLERLRFIVARFPLASFLWSIDDKRPDSRTFIAQKGTLQLLSVTLRRMRKLWEPPFLTWPHFEAALERKKRMKDGKEILEYMIELPAGETDFNHEPSSESFLKALEFGSMKLIEWMWERGEAMEIKDWGEVLKIYEDRRNSFEEEIMRFLWGSEVHDWLLQRVQDEKGDEEGDAELAETTEQALPTKRKREENDTNQMEREMEGDEKLNLMDEEAQEGQESEKKKPKPNLFVNE